MPDLTDALATALFLGWTLTIYQHGSAVYARWTGPDHALLGEWRGAAHVPVETIQVAAQQALARHAPAPLAARWTA